MYHISWNLKFPSLPVLRISNCNTAQFFLFLQIYFVQGILRHTDTDLLITVNQLYAPCPGLLSRYAAVDPILAVVENCII